MMNFVKVIRMRGRSCAMASSSIDLITSGNSLLGITVWRKLKTEFFVICGIVAITNFINIRAAIILYNVIRDIRCEDVALGWVRSDFDSHTKEVMDNVILHVTNSSNCPRGITSVPNFMQTISDIVYLLYA